MQKLTIKNLGPIVDCTVEIRDFMVFTGPQASGKSTIAKSIFFFNNLKNILYTNYFKLVTVNKVLKTESLEDSFTRILQKAFRQSFGLESVIKSSGMVAFEYDNSSRIEIVFEPVTEGISIKALFDDTIKRQLKTLEQMFDTDARNDAEKIKKFINEEIFASDMNVIYIPAGRSLLTMLSSQINYIYAVLDEQQKNSIDYCTQCYLEEVFRIKEFFDSSLDRLMRRVVDEADYQIKQSEAEAAIQLIRNILHGEYRNINGEERLYYSEEQYVKMNYASSGQQEAVWITNILLYHMLGRYNTCFIIEEPESHLFPETQKQMIELISLIKNGRNRAIITTHSPYILGSVNNLLYANFIAGDVDGQRLSKIVNDKIWLEFENMSAYYITDGKLKDIRDDEIENINHDVIDGVSEIINEDFESMVSLKFECKGDA
ncbi:AAA domain-containing protein, putative AbiEii toxin, Type IV TA system [Lachnospiraceae bacterium]|nr:AAA domain-containing protein, putative AbiEii toxin, Type IV TA system [Lachnospiraceae bacterium]